MPRGWVSCHPRLSHALTNKLLCYHQECTTVPPEPTPLTPVMVRLLASHAMRKLPSPPREALLGIA